MVRRTHTRKDGTFIDKKAEALLLRAQNLATQRCSANETESTVTGPSHNELTAAYIEVTISDLFSFISLLVLLDTVIFFFIRLLTRLRSFKNRSFC